MADQQIRTHTRWTRRIDVGDPYEHVYVTFDGHWSVTRSWTFTSGDVALAWAKSIVEPDMEAWVAYGSDRTGIAPPG